MIKHSLVNVILYLVCSAWMQESSKNGWFFVFCVAVIAGPQVRWVQGGSLKPPFLPLHTQPSYTISICKFVSGLQASLPLRITAVQNKFVEDQWMCAECTAKQFMPLWWKDTCKEIAISDAREFTSSSSSEAPSTMKIQLNNLKSCYLSKNIWNCIV